MDKPTLRFAVSAPITVVVVALSMVPALQFDYWQWVVAALSLPVVTWGAWPFHQAALRSARHGSTTMDTLVSLGVTVSTLWSLWALFFGGAGRIGIKMHMSFLPATTTSGHADIYFEGACVIVVFLMLGRMIEARTRHEAGDALRSLLEMNVTDARRRIFDEDGTFREQVVSSDDLMVNDMVVIRPGEKIPADGIIVEGSSAVDTSLISGESLPVDVAAGDEVTGASINTWGGLVVRVTRVGADTTLARIGHMVAEAQADKADVQRLADKVSGVFVPVVVALSVLTFITWLLIGGPIQAAITAAVAVLVVACPCALGLATPTALLVGSGRASQLGIILRSAQVLENTRRIDTLVLDKTGTITTGNMSLEQVVPVSPGADTQALLAEAAAVEAFSQHPVGEALVRAGTETGLPLPSVSEFVSHAGRGVSALKSRSSVSEDTLVLVGQPQWLADVGFPMPENMSGVIAQAEESGATVVALAHGSVPSLKAGESIQASPASVAVDSLSIQGTSTPTPAHAHSLHVQEAPPTEASPRFASSESSTVDVAASPATTYIDLRVEGMTCASCVRRVERKLSKLEGVEATVNLATESARVSLSRPWSDEEIRSVIDAAGYRAAVIDRHSEAESKDETQIREAGDSEYVVRSLEGIEGAIVGVFTIRDQVKDTSAQAVQEIKDLGITPVMLTGDSFPAARHVASQVNVASVHAHATPESKKDFIANLQADGAMVAMVGDGVNDAVALAQAGHAGLGIAMGSGTDVARDVADIILTTSDLRAAASAIRISRRTLRIIKQNLGWAFGYNIAMLPLAMLGLLNPMIAAAAMSASSICVVANSLRLRSAR
ncbi:MAG: heavy metal translocating P-type ATPase [Actinobacteria bacterium]|nr:MAG: heavy metal translocating P-type ATPase [Actinomycetota bacterium]